MLTDDANNECIYNSLNWACQVKLFRYTGLSSLWYFDPSLQISVATIESLILDQSNQTLKSEISNSNRLRLN